MSPHHAVLPTRHCGVLTFFLASSLLCVMCHFFNHVSIMFQSCFNHVRKNLGLCHNFQS